MTSVARSVAKPGAMQTARCALVMQTTAIVAQTLHCSSIMADVCLHVQQGSTLRNQCVQPVRHHVLRAQVLGTVRPVAPIDHC